MLSHRIGSTASIATKTMSSISDARLVGKTYLRKPSKVQPVSGHGSR